MAVPKADRDDNAERFRQKFLNSPYFIRVIVNILIAIFRKIVAVQNFFYNIEFDSCTNFKILIAIIVAIVSILCSLVFERLSLSTKPPLVVGVLSKRDNFMERLAIRNTWAVDIAQLEQESHLVFVLGDSDCPVHPDLRADKTSCDFYDINQEKSDEWKSVDIKTEKLVTRDQNSCILGFGIKTLTDVLVTKAEIEKKFLLNKEDSELWMKYGDSSDDAITLKLNSDVDYFLRKGILIEFILKTNENACEELNENRCDWSDGKGSIKYTFVRFTDGSVQPWSDNFCTPFSIQFENGKEICPSGWHLYKGHCYYYSEKELNWKDSSKKCEELNSTLVSIQSEEENKFVSGFRCNGCSLWIGLFSTTDSGLRNWKWLDRTETTFDNWDTYEPNNWNTHLLCVEMVSYNAKWNDHSCYTANNFVCKKNRVSNLSDKVSIKPLEHKWLKHIKTVDERINEERRQFGDIIVIADLQDTYASLPQKVKTLIKWTHTHHPNAWLFKTDDDTHVNVDKLDGIITRSVMANKKRNDENSTTPTLFSAPPLYPPTVFSHFNKRRAVPRFGKNAEYEYDCYTFPSFPSGAGYLMTDAVIEGLSIAHDSLRTFQGEDVSVGLWLSSLKFKTGTNEYVTNFSFKRLYSYCLQMFKMLFRPILAQVTDNRSYSQNTELLQYNGHQNYVPANLISVPCWVNSTIVSIAGCTGINIVTPELSISDVVALYNKQKETET